MLVLLQEKEDKKAAQSILMRNLKSALKRQGTRNIGFPGGNIDHTVYSNGDGHLLVAFGKPTQDVALPRYWNAFGIYKSTQFAQTITVEINIAIDSNTAQVAGLFAKDENSDDIFLMHSGKVGGGRLGIGKSAFLVWSKAKLIDVTAKDANIRSGIVVGKIDDPNLSEHIWTFVKNVKNFKNQATTGELDTPEFRKEIEEFDKYRKEFTGRKKGVRNRTFEYITYHGEIVHALYDDRIARLMPGEKVFNSSLIDLCVTKNSTLTEVYEVKTGIGRQMLYTAIGQIVTHATAGGEGVAKFLVIPTDEDIPKDFKQAIAALGIQIRRFRFVGKKLSKKIEFY